MQVTADDADNAIAICLTRFFSNGAPRREVFCSTKSDTRNQFFCRLIFPAGISRGREVVGHCSRNKATWLKMSLPQRSPISRGTAGAKRGLLCQTQPNRISTCRRLRSVREVPVNQQYAARFLNLHPKKVHRKAREGSLPAYPIETSRKPRVGQRGRNILAIYRSIDGYLGAANLQKSHST